MDNDPYPTWNPSFSTGMPQSGGARGLPDLNFPPEDQGVTEEPSNPQHGPSNSQPGPSNLQPGSSNLQPGSSNLQPGPSNPQTGPTNPQPGPSNPRAPPNSPEQDPPDKSFFQDGVVNPRPFFTGKVAEAFEGMRRILAGIRRRSKHKKEGEKPKRKNAKRGQPKSEDSRKRNKRSPGGDGIEI